MRELEEVKHVLLAWAGLHRGKAISEEAMPRFHDIIDFIDAIIQLHNAKCSALEELRKLENK